MGLFRDFKNYNLYSNKKSWPKEIFNPANWRRAIQWRHQRAERGWSDRDTWGGGEHIASVAHGILIYLDNVQNVLDWDEYFKVNYDVSYGYTSLREVAQDIDNYLAWEELSFSEPILSQFKDDNETRWAIENQLYENYKDAMHFVAENIGGLWW